MPTELKLKSFQIYKFHRHEKKFETQTSILKFINSLGVDQTLIFLIIEFV